MSVQLSISSLSLEHKKIISKLLFFQPKPDFYAIQSFQSSSAPPSKDPIIFYISNSLQDVIFLPFTFANTLLNQICNSSISYPFSSYSFMSTLRPDQELIAADAFEKLSTVGSVILGCHPGFGKCLAYNTSLLLFNGLSKPVQDICIGDTLRGSDNFPRHVLSLAQGFGPLYEISPSSGDPFTANADHILTLYSCLDNNIVDIPISQLSNPQLYHVIWYPTVYSPRVLSFDPFTFGQNFDQFCIPLDIKINDIATRQAFLLGWLSQYSASIILNYCQRIGWYHQSKIYIPTNFLDQFRFNETYFQLGYDQQHVDNVDMDMCGSYILGILSRPQICDNKELAKELVYLGRSIGWPAKRQNDYIEITVGKTGQYIHESFEIRSVGSGQYYGFTLDCDGRFLLSSQMITHNTVVSAYLGSKIDGAILVLYHRTILQDQWLATFRKFTNAGVWVYGETVPEDFNVILTMDTKIAKLPTEVLTLVKCLIIDEAHAFCVPSRLNALLITQPRYIIACSATLDTRTDGMQDMIYALCGYNIVNKNACKQFRVYKMMTNISPEIKQTRIGKLDWNQLQKDLAENPIRNNNIVDLVKENIEHKIIILTKFRHHVQILYEMLTELDISVDTLFGTKKSYLDSQVLIGTFSKIGTGFDEATACSNFGGRKANLLIICASIKHLGNLEQYVGRVFRVDAPIIFHLVDSVPIIHNHWTICQRWYQERGAEIYSVNLNPTQQEAAIQEEINTRPATQSHGRIKPISNISDRLKALSNTTK